MEEKTGTQQAAPGNAAAPAAPTKEAIAEPAKLLRIVSMVRELLDETRQASMDDKGRAQLRQIYERSLMELKDVLSPDLRRELETLAIPMQGVPTESEIRVAQAQLVGWLEGLFHGIQAALWTQQMAARAQFEEMRRRGLTPGEQQEASRQHGRPGQYL
ncbi:MAG: proteasome activator [Actinomycetota bacterium]